MKMYVYTHIFAYICILLSFLPLSLFIHVQSHIHTDDMYMASFHTRYSTTLSTIREFSSTIINISFFLSVI